MIFLVVFPIIGKNCEKNENIYEITVNLYFLLGFKIKVEI